MGYMACDKEQAAVVRPMAACWGKLAGLTKERLEGMKDKDRFAVTVSAGTDTDATVSVLKSLGQAFGVNDVTVLPGSSRRTQRSRRGAFDWIEDAAEGTAGFVEDRVEDTVDLGTTVGEGTVDGLTTVGEGVVDLGEAIGETTVYVVSEGASLAVDGINLAGKVVVPVFQVATDVLSKVSNATIGQLGIDPIGEVVGVVSNVVRMGIKIAYQIPGLSEVVSVAIRTFNEARRLLQDLCELVGLDFIALLLNLFDPNIIFDTIEMQRALETELSKPVGLGPVMSQSFGLFMNKVPDVTGGVDAALDKLDDVLELSTPDQLNPTRLLRDLRLPFGRKTFDVALNNPVAKMLRDRITSHFFSGNFKSADDAAIGRLIDAKNLSDKADANEWTDSLDASLADSLWSNTSATNFLSQFKDLVDRMRGLLSLPGTFADVMEDVFSLMEEIIDANPVLYSLSDTPIGKILDFLGIQLTLEIRLTDAMAWLLAIPLVLLTTLTGKREVVLGALEAGLPKFAPESLTAMAAALSGSTRRSSLRRASRSRRSITGDRVADNILLYSFQSAVAAIEALRYPSTIKSAQKIASKREAATGVGMLALKIKVHAITGEQLAGRGLPDVFWVPYAASTVTLAMKTLWAIDKVYVAYAKRPVVRLNAVMPNPGDTISPKTGVSKFLCLPYMMEGVLSTLCHAYVQVHVAVDMGHSDPMHGYQYNPFKIVKIYLGKAVEINTAILVYKGHPPNPKLLKVGILAQFAIGITDAIQAGEFGHLNDTGEN